MWWSSHRPFLEEAQNPTYGRDWEARTNVHGVGQLGDAGLSAQPILLHLPTPPPGLASVLKVQSLVDQWYAQEAVHAFTALPSVLMLQLGRFLVRDGQIHKLQTQVHADEFIWIPLFTNANFQVRPVKYERIAVICHHGEHPSSHYQAILHDGCNCWSCDDNRGSHSCTTVPPWHAKGCYLLLYKRVPDPTSEIVADSADNLDHHCFPIFLA